MVVYQDNHGVLPDGQIFYPDSLGLISPALTELNKESMHDIDTYQANLMLEIEMIMGFYGAIRETHRAALEIYEGYRNEGRQYCLYLRSFDWSGRFSDDEMYLAPLDLKFKSFLRDSLSPEIAVVSFVNVRELYGGAVDPQAAIPSLRVLSHNWKEVVREVIRGACLVVLNTWEEEAEGLAYEAGLVAECGMESRTIVTGARISGSGVLAAGSYASVIDRGETWFPLDGPAAGRLAGIIRRLSADDFRQVNQVRDLSELPSWVLDRNIELARAQFSADELAGLPYENYIPSSLLNNWKLLADLYPKMYDSWKAIESQFAAGSRVAGGDMFRAVDAAVHTFWIASTLERYYEMAMSLSIIGMAFRMVTGKLDTMVKCYAYAADCAGWSGDPELANFLSDAYSRLRREAANDD
jgi:hypothetical protein